MPNNSTSTSPKPSRGGNAAAAKKLLPEKSASFHGRIPTEHRPMRRPKTQPDLLAGRRSGGGGWASSPESSSSPVVAAADMTSASCRVPTKVLVNVTVQRSLGPVQVMASTNWTVGNLVAAAIKQYVKEGRRPPLPSPGEPSDFGLHYSQFSLERLDPEEKLIGLGSRNFFLCPKSPLPLPLAPSSPPLLDRHCPGGASAVPSSSCSNQAAEKASKIVLPWLRFMDFLL